MGGFPRKGLPLTFSLGVLNMANMATDNDKRVEVPAYCPRCRRERRFFREPVPDLGFNLLLLLVTVGLWLPILLLRLLIREMRPWKCENCRWRAPVFAGRKTAILGASQPLDAARERTETHFLG